MAVQNLVSATLATETKEEILASLAGIRKKLNFLLTLEGAEVTRLYKAGKEMGPFVDGCHAAAQAHPEILAGVFDHAEFLRDFQLSKDLGEVGAALEQLSEGVSHTVLAARSDALMAALDIYKAIKAHRSRVPGLQTVADDLARYFYRTPRRPAAGPKS